MDSRSCWGLVQPTPSESLSYPQKRSGRVINIGVPSQRAQLCPRRCPVPALCLQSIRTRGVMRIRLHDCACTCTSVCQQIHSSERWGGRCKHRGGARGDTDNMVYKFPTNLKKQMRVQAWLWACMTVCNHGWIGCACTCGTENVPATDTAASNTALPLPLSEGGPCSKAPPDPHHPALGSTRTTRAV